MKIRRTMFNPREPIKNWNVQNQNWRFSFKEKLHNIDQFWFSPQNLKLSHKEQGFICLIKNLVFDYPRRRRFGFSPEALTFGSHRRGFVLLFLLQEMEESLGFFFPCVFKAKVYVLKHKFWQVRLWPIMSFNSCYFLNTNLTCEEQRQVQKLILFMSAQQGSSWQQLSELYPLKSLCTFAIYLWNPWDLSGKKKKSLRSHDVPVLRAYEFCVLGSFDTWTNKPKHLTKRPVGMQDIIVSFQVGQ